LAKSSSTNVGGEGRSNESAYVAADESKGRVSGREKVNRQLAKCWLCACRQKWTQLTGADSCVAHTARAMNKPSGKGAQVAQSNTDR